jgi:hypothetical protein
MGDFLIIKLYVSFIAPDQANNHVKAGGFACSIWTEQTNNLTFVDFH